MMKFFGVFCSHSWAGEDSILRQLIQNPTNWTYLDIGSGHPTYLSNTFWMYSNGATGVLVDCNIFLIDFSKKLRPKDKCINVAVGSQEGDTTFYEFNSWSLTTSNVDWVENYRKQGMTPVRTYEVKTRTLYDLYQEIDSSKDLVVSLDIEGASTNVINAFIDNYRNKLITILPKVWLLEVDEWPSNNIEDQNAILELLKLGYRVLYYHDRTLILVSF